MREELIFLKLGGSLITDKAKEANARKEEIERIASEIAEAMKEAVGIKLLIGHGSGSFGHVAARKFGTRDGVSSPADWMGFIEVWQAARALNQIVMETFEQAKLLALAFPPSASATARDGELIEWDSSVIEAAIAKGLIPVVYGDVIFDKVRGGTICSTEELFAYLAKRLKPQRILLAANEPVYAKYPEKIDVVESIDREKLGELKGIVGESEAADVTGGMLGKVESMLGLVEELPEIEVRVFGGVESGAIRRVLLGERSGTLIRAKE